MFDYFLFLFRTMECLMTGTASSNAIDNYDEADDKDLDPEDLGKTNNL